VKRRVRQQGRAELLYLWALVRRFRLTFASLFVLVIGGGTALYFLYARAGVPLGYGRALVVAYFLLFAQPVQELPAYGPIEVISVIIPPLGLVTVAEGLVRFAFLFFAKQRDDKEWFTVLAQTLKDHVIVCGAGRVGFRIFEQYRRLDVPMVVIERNADTPFVSAIREAGVPVLIESAQLSGVLERANLAAARAIICATDDDLANLNIALDARRLKPHIRVVMRLFDDDLVARTREAFDVDAFSTSALAAPAMAVAALDPSIRNSFDVGGRLMVIAELTVAEVIAGRTAGELRERNQLTVLHIVKANGQVVAEPQASARLEMGDRATVQATLTAYQAFYALVR
jgi:Trk K+ transport system NAD-binding subunit